MRAKTGAKAGAKAKAKKQRAPTKLAAEPRFGGTTTIERFRSRCATRVDVHRARDE